MFTTQLHLRGESRSGEGDPRLPPTFLHELCKLRESHWIWRHGSSHITWTWEVPFPRLTTLHNALGFCGQSEYRGAIDKYDCFRVSTWCSKPHSPAESRKARSLSNTISVTLNSGLLTAGRWRKYQLSLPVIRHPEQTKNVLIIVRV